MIEITNPYAELVDETELVDEKVNHPNHYKTGKFECIDVMIEVFGVHAVMIFCKLNAFKYLYRTNRKNGVVDIEKGEWYLSKYLELSKGEQDD